MFKLIFCSESRKTLEWKAPSEFWPIVSSIFRQVDRLPNNCDFSNMFVLSYFLANVYDEILSIKMLMMLLLSYYVLHSLHQLYHLKVQNRDAHHTTTRMLLTRTNLQQAYSYTCGSSIGEYSIHLDWFMVQRAFPVTVLSEVMRIFSLRFHCYMSSCHVKSQLIWHCFSSFLEIQHPVNPVWWND